MRARTRRLRPLFSGIVVLHWVHHGPSPAANRGDAMIDDFIPECAPLCLAKDSGWGRAIEVERGRRVSLRSDRLAIESRLGAFSLVPAYVRRPNGPQGQIVS